MAASSVSPLDVECLVKNFKKGFRSVLAVNGVSFSMEKGEILGFLGPNGAGKTTTIKCMLGLLSPTSGKIDIWGAHPASASIRKLIGYVPENPDYEDVFSPMEFLQMFAGMRNMSQSKKEIISLLGRVGLTGWEDVRIRQFSKGMRQRLSLAVALQFKPELIIMDEPTGGLDPAARKEFRDIILEEHSRGATVFLSSHLLSEVEAICHRAIILSHGEVVIQGTMDELLKCEDEYRISFSIPAQSDGQSQVSEITVNEKKLQRTIDSLRNRDCEITRIEQVYKSLEDVFLSATGEVGQ